MKKGDVVEVVAGSRYVGSTGTVISVGHGNGSFYYPDGVLVTFGKGFTFQKKELFPSSWLKEVKGG